MATIAVLEALVRADTASAEAKLGAFGRQVDALGSSGSKSLSRLQTVGAVAFAALGASALAFAGKSVSAYNENVLAQTKLQNTLSKSPRLSDVAASSWQAQASSLQHLTGVQDEAIVSADALLGQFGMTGQQVQALTPLVVDLSQKMGIDLTAASKAVGKATEGNVGLLQRYGILVDKTKAKTDAYGATVDALARTVGGFATQQGKTFEGQMKILSADFNDFQESVGKVVVQFAGPFLHVLNATLDTFNKLPGPVKAGAVLLVGVTGAAVGLGLAVNVLRTALGGLGISFGTSTVAAEASTVALGENAVAAGTDAAALDGVATAAGAARFGLLGALGVLGIASVAATVATKAFVGLDDRLHAMVYSATINAEATRGGAAALADAAAAAYKAQHATDALNTTAHDSPRLLGVMNQSVDAASGSLRGMADWAQTATHQWHMFGMTRGEIRAWAQGTRAGLNSVEGSLQNLAGQAHLTSGDVLKAFTDQLSKMRDYQGNWQKLLDRGLPASLAKQLQDMGSQGAGIVAALAGANDKQFDRIIAKWVASQGVAKATAGQIQDVGRAVAVLPNGKVIKIVASVDGMDQVRQLSQLVGSLAGASTVFALQHHASGTMSAPAGWSWVGEQGPELVRLRGGEQIASARQSAQMVGASHQPRSAAPSPTVVNVYVGTVVGPSPADFARLVTPHIEREMRFRRAVHGS